MALIPATSAGSPLDGTDHQNPLVAVKTVVVRQFGAQVLDLHPQPAARHTAAVPQLLDDALGEVDRDGETDPLAAGNDGRVDAHHFAPHVEQGAAAVAGVDGGIGLDEIVVWTRSDGAALGTDDAGGDGLLKTEGTAHGHDPLSYGQGIRIPQFQGGEAIGTLDADEGQIRVGITPYDLGSVLLAAGKADLDFIRRFDDVVVGHDIAVFTDNEARARLCCRKSRG
jgi:hypothetical protein